MSNRKVFCKGLTFVLVVLGLIFICLGGVVENEGMKMKTTTLNSIVGRRRDDGETVIGRVNGKLRLHFISKRRVPNGADPIHNRRAGNSHQPPGKA